MSKLEELAYKIKELLEKHDLYHDIRIYFEEKALDSNNGLIEDIVASEYIEYANDKTITMSFEGPFNHLLNYGTGDIKVIPKFEKLLERYGYYYELGYAWSLSLYEI